MQHDLHDFRSLCATADMTTAGSLQFHVVEITRLIRIIGRSPASGLPEASSCQEQRCQVVAIIYKGFRVIHRTLP